VLANTGLCACLESFESMQLFVSLFLVASTSAVDCLENSFKVTYYETKCQVLHILELSVYVDEYCAPVACRWDKMPSVTHP